MPGRKFLIKFVAVLVTILFIHILTSNSGSFIREMQQSGRDFAAMDSKFLQPEAPAAVAVINNNNNNNNELQPVNSEGDNVDVIKNNVPVVESEQNVPPPPPPPPNKSPAGAEVITTENAGDDLNVNNDLALRSATSVNNATTAAASTSVAAAVSQYESEVLEKVRRLTKCLDRPMTAKTQQRGDYWVLYNYIKAEKTFRCHESITYTTHADYSFMDNLVPLLERWRGPISVAIHAPGSDFQNTLDSIAYLRECIDAPVKEYVTFHIYFSTKHVPKEVPKHTNVYTEPYNCSVAPPYFNVSSDQMYKSQKKLLYPVNVGRNVAREMAQTHFILPSDIELYPSPNIIPRFLKMIAENKGPLRTSTKPKVFPLHIFEVAANQQVPETKTELLTMLANGSALPFHKKLCPGCHNIPRAKEWQNSKETEGLHVFYVGKRNAKFIHWEPIFIGTHADPLYDERLSWEGMSDKMTQGYALCVLDYDFMILDNAFLVHKPGIKIYRKDPRRSMLASKTNQLIRKIILPELKVLYGVRKGCAV